MILVDRQEEDFPFTRGNLTMEELDFLTRHEEEIPATLEKLNKEKQRNARKIIGRIEKKKFKYAYRHAMIVIVFI